MVRVEAVSATSRIAAAAANQRGTWNCRTFDGLVGAGTGDTSGADSGTGEVPDEVSRTIACQSASSTATCGTAIPSRSTAESIAETCSATSGQLIRFSAKNVVASASSVPNAK